MLLEKDSQLTACVNEAIAVLKADGTLDALKAEWLPEPPAELAPYSGQRRRSTNPTSLRLRTSRPRDLTRVKRTMRPRRSA